MRGARLPQERCAAIAEAAAAACGLGAPASFEAVTTGYEDTVLRVATPSGRFVVKTFAPPAGPGPDPARRAAGIIRAAIAAGVRHPRLHGPAWDGGGGVVHAMPDDGTRYLVMDHIDGRDAYGLGRPVSARETADLIAQVARLHTVRLTPEPVTDPWAIPQLPATAAALAPHLDSAARRLVAAAVDALAAVPAAALPRALIHGDLTMGNVLVDTTGRVHLIDFGAAGHHPRIQELAVAAANLTANSPEPLPQRLTTLADQYARHHRLTPAEHAALPAYGFAAAAMEFLGAAREYHLHHDRSAETLWLLHIGRDGMRQCATGST